MDDWMARVLAECPGRVAGTAACHRASEIVGDLFATVCGPHAVDREPFWMRPRGFLKFVAPGVASLYVTYALIGVGWYGAALLLALFPLLAFLSQIVFYRSYFDWLFPRRRGYNVVGDLPPQGEPRQRVILCAHHDAAYVFRVMERAPRLYPVAMVATLVVDLLAIILSVLALFGIRVYAYVLVWFMVGVTPLLVAHGAFTGERASEGVGDNLASVALIAEIVRGLLTPEGTSGLGHTAVRLISFDGEESGLRGSRAYCRTHQGELRGDVPVLVLNLESLYRLAHLCLVDRDLNGLVPLDAPLRERLVHLSHEMGYSHVRPVSLIFGSGATDAAEFARAGVPAATFLGISPDTSSLGESVYHTSRDTVGSVEPAALRAVAAVVTEFVLRLDREHSAPAP
jgi:hypothetical protein